MSRKIGVVLSQFHSDISMCLEERVIAELIKAQVKNFQLVRVPGVVEIPLTAQVFFKAGYDAVIALGVVIRGETEHYSACCRLVEQGCMQVQLKANQPLIFGVLMTDNKEQALARSGGKKGHIARSSVQAALEMLATLEQIKKGK